MDRQIDIQIDKHKDRQTDRQTYRFITLIASHHQKKATKKMIHPTIKDRQLDRQTDEIP